MYSLIKVLEAKGEGAIETAVISVELRKGDQIRIRERSSLGREFRPFEVVGFEPGRNGRRALLRTPDGDKLHMEIGDSVEVHRPYREESEAVIDNG